jgi:protocatechuate 3,4-dioxygenase beta subunit
LQGTVTDVASGLPLEGAFVFARLQHDGPQHRPLWARTNGDGAYLIDDVPVGDYAVSCWMRGYYQAHSSATVADGQVAVVDFALDELAFGSVTGVVTDAGTGEPISGALVSLRPPVFPEAGGQDGGFWITAVTGDDGTYLIEHVLAGAYAISARSFGYTPSEPVSVEVVDGEVSVVDITLDPLTFGSLEGTVTDAATGDPIEGAWVVARMSHGHAEGGDHPDCGWYSAQTDASGHYLFEELIAGDYSVYVWAAGYPMATAQAEVIGDETTVVDFALEGLAFGNIEGTVTDAATGDPVELALVMLCPAAPDAGGRGQQSSDCGYHAVTDANGFYSIDEVLVGTYSVRVHAHGYQGASAEAEVLAAQTTVVDFSLETWDGARLGDAF